MHCGPDTPRSATSDCAPTATTSTSNRRASSPTTSTTPTRRSVAARSAVRRGDRGVHRRRVRRARHRCPTQAGRHRRRAHHRQGRRRRRQLVLEPLSRRAVRHGGVHLPAAARGDRPHADREVHARARDPRALPAHRQPLRPLRQRLPVHRGHLGRVGRSRAIAGSSAPTAATRCGPSTSPWAPARCTVRSCPASPASRRSRGHSFHTSRWDYAYTGGDASGAPMVGLADKRVGIIGTGATSVQCIPHLARAAGELFVFQRTPSSIDIRNNQPIDPDWFATLEPGWQDEWLMNFTTLQTGGFADADLVMDGWTDISQRIRDRAIANGDFSPDGLLRAYHDSDDEKMEEIRAARRRDHRRPERRRGAQAVVPPAVQAAVLPRRVPAVVQQPERPPDRHRRQGRRADRRDRGVGRRRALRARLPDLRVGVRGRHAARTTDRLRPRRPRRHHAVGALGRRDAIAARHPRPQLPERVHRQPGAGREPDLQRAAQPDRVGFDDRRDHRPRRGDRRRGDRGDRRGRGRLGGDAPRRRALVRRRPDVHARLLQQRGRRDPPGMRSASATPTARWRTSSTSRPGASPATSKASTSAEPETPGVRPQANSQGGAGR